VSRSDGPIGVFDSGVGGLAVLWELRRLLPAEDLLYFADQAHFPYGPRPLAEVRELALRAAGLLVERGAKLIVVACNTASSAALPALRAALDVPVVGIEPAVKPACALTRCGRVGVLATSGTVTGDALDRLVERTAGGIEVVRIAAGGLVELIESGEGGAPLLESALAQALAPLRAAEVDVVALGCTHFAFVRSAVERMLGPGVAVLEPAAAVARQAARVLEREGLLAPQGRQGTTAYDSSSDRTRLREAVARLAPSATDRGAYLHN
jgi:glutamate racemase